jgi:FixJ family two-component response regulator
VLEDLFRDGEMPEGGQQILQGVASGRTHDEIADDLGITPDQVEGRARMMRGRLRARLAKLDGKAA